jgi:ABC-2 type transport system permease protein
MRLLSISRKDLQLALKDSGNLIYLFLVPLLFIFILGGGLSAVAGDEEATDVEVERLSLPVVNLDSGGEMTTLLLRQLEETTNITLIPLDEPTAERQLNEQDINHVLTIPAGFSAAFAAGETTELRLVNHPNANSNVTEALRLAVDSVAQDLALEQQLVASLEQMGAMQAAAAPEEQAFTADRTVAQARAQFEASQDRPLIVARQTLPGQLMAPDTEPQFSDTNIKVPGFTVLFIFLAAQTAALSIYEEKKVGSFRRLLAAPLSKVELLGGKLLPNFVLVLLQIVVIGAAAYFLFPLLGLDRINLGQDPIAIVLLCLAVALCSTCLGLLIAALAHTEGQIGGLSTVIIWGTGIIGGSFMPAFLMSDVLDKVARAVPQYWAIGGFYDLMVLGGGLADIVPALGMLLAFSVLFGGIGLWRFEYR